MDTFNYGYALFGGMLIGFSAVLLMWFNGKLTAISGMLHDLLPPQERNSAPIFTFLIGLVIGSVIYYQFSAIQFTPRENFSYAWLLLGGILIGFGTRFGCGCTSGHGICGLARLSKRSLVATITFVLSGMITVYITRHLLHIL